MRSVDIFFCRSSVAHGSQLLSRFCTVEPRMGQDQIFAVIGDSNVRRFVTSLTKKACPDITNAQISSCGKLSMLAEALRQVTTSSTKDKAILLLSTAMLSAFNSMKELMLMATVHERTVTEIRQVTTSSTKDKAILLFVF
jgi:hypothetical protein